MFLGQEELQKMPRKSEQRLNHSMKQVTLSKSGLKKKANGH